MKRIQQLRLIDDDFFAVCLEGDPKAAQLLLRIILDRDDIIVKEVHTQRTMKNLTGRTVCLDILAEDSTGKRYNIEVQRDDRGAKPKRARYHSSILDTSSLGHGKSFEELPETYVIFITEKDVLKGDRPLYRIDRIVRETKKEFQDEAHIVYVNASKRNSRTRLGKLMEDFYCSDPDDMHYAELAEKVRYYKEDERGTKKMCRILDEMKEEVAEKVAKETEKKTTEKNKKRFAKRMLRKGKYTLKEVAECSELPMKTVKEIRDSLNA